MMRQQNLEPIRSKFHADPLYQPLILDFLADLPRLGKEIINSIDQADWHAAQQFCHQLKGTAATYGYEDLAAIVSDIESRSKEVATHGPASAASIGQLMNKLDNLINRMLAAKSQL